MLKKIKILIVRCHDEHDEISYYYYLKSQPSQLSINKSWLFKSWLWVSKCSRPLGLPEMAKRKTTKRTVTPYMNLAKNLGGIKIFEGGLNQKFHRGGRSYFQSPPPAPGPPPKLMYGQIIKNFFFTFNIFMIYWASVLSLTLNFPYK